MPTAQKLTLAVLINAALISSVYASEQSEAKGFLEDASGSVLLRTGFIDRDKKNGVEDTRSTAQSAIFKLESGYTQGIVGFGVGAVGDGSFKIGKNNHAGNQMIPLHNDGAKDANGHVDAYDSTFFLIFSKNKSPIIFMTLFHSL